MVSARNKKLIRAYGGRAMPFTDLPVPAQLAIAWYMAVDGDVWELPRGYNPYKPASGSIQQEFQSMLPWFRIKYGTKKIGYVEIPAEALIETIMQDEDFDQERFKDFDQYHEWYVQGQRMPDHPATGRWPVTLSNNNEETLQDGWHRLHDYYRKGSRTIPAVYFP